MILPSLGLQVGDPVRVVERLNFAGRSYEPGEILTATGGYGTVECLDCDMMRVLAWIWEVQKAEPNAWENDLELL